MLGEGSQQDAEELARAAGATAILRPGQPHPVPLHAPDAVIDLAAPGHDGGREDAVIDLVPPGASDQHDEVIDLVVPGDAHAAQATPGSIPDTAVVIDPAEVADVPALVAAVHVVLNGLTQVEETSQAVCVVASRLVTDTLKLVDDAGVLLGTADRDEHRWVSTPLAGPLEVLTAVAGLEPAAAADEASSPSVRPLLEALIRHGVEVRTVPI